MSFTLDPEVAEALAPFLPPPGSTPPPAGEVAPRVALLEGLFRYAETARPHPGDVAITEHELATPDGATIPLRWYARKDAAGEAAAPGPAALYLHGGGMIAGHADMFDGYVSRYVSASGTSILSADYRLAPEHPYPVPVEDAYAALDWLHKHAAGLGADPARIGDSAGGGLAAAVSILARDRKGPAITRQILIMAMLDDRNLTPDPRLAPFAGWTWDDNRTGWQALLGDAAGGPDTPAYASPARVADPAGLPPAYIEVGQLDIFRDENLTYALRLGRAGVPVEFHLHPGVPHEFDFLAPDTAAGRRVIADRVRALASL